MTTRPASAITPPIVVGTALSESGAMALREAAKRARVLGAELVVCHAATDLIALERYIPDVARVLDQARTEIERRVHAHVTEALGEGHGARVVIEVGSPSKVLLMQATQCGASLLVVAASTKSAVDRTFLGSTADQVARHSSTDVLVVRPSSESGVVIAGTDLAHAELPAIRAAFAEAKAGDKHVVAMHVLPKPSRWVAMFEPSVAIEAVNLVAKQESCTEVLRAAIARFGEGQAQVTVGRAASVLCEAATDLDAELLVVASHGKSEFLQVALGSVAAGVVRHAPCSVLVVRYRQASQDATAG